MGNNCYVGNCSNGECSPNRGFLTNDEKIEMLKEYKKNLDNESKGVTERIAELQKE